MNSFRLSFAAGYCILFVLSCQQSPRDNSLDAYLPKNNPSSDENKWPPGKMYPHWPIYTDYGFAIQYPPDWQAKQASGISATLAPLTLSKPGSDLSVRLHLLITFTEGDSLAGACDEWAELVESEAGGAATVRPFSMPGSGDSADSRAGRVTVQPFAPADGRGWRTRIVTARETVRVGARNRPVCRLRYGIVLDNGDKLSETAWFFSDPGDKSAMVLIGSGQSPTLDSIAQTLVFKN